MSKLTYFKFPDSDMTMIYVNDVSIPQHVKAYFVRDYKSGRRAKIKVKPKEGKGAYKMLKPTPLSMSVQSSVTGLLHTIARQYGYDYDKLIERARLDKLSGSHH